MFLNLVGVVNAAKKYKELSLEEKKEFVETFEVSENYSWNQTTDVVEYAGRDFQKHVNKLGKLGEEAYREAGWHVVSYVARKVQPGNNPVLDQSSALFGTGNNQACLHDYLVVLINTSFDRAGSRIWQVGE